MDNADILVFLFSQHFISSSECMKEWDSAKKLAEEGNKLLFRIPIILSDCAWLDVLGEDSIKALPRDGKAISAFREHASAWQQVYQGIKSVVENINNSFSPRPQFLESISRTEFIFKKTAMLPDIFVAPTLRHHQLQSSTATEFRNNVIELEHLLQNKYSLIYGDDVSGKTSLARHPLFDMLPG